MAELPFCFTCEGDRLLGILHLPSQYMSTGVLIVVGGPQYRVGSHRQFLILARFLASKGIPVMRFDYRAMGDSEGEGVDFEGVHQDIASAIEQFIQRAPSVTNIILWGLCDAASASLFYAHSDARVKGMVLLNPWVRTEVGEAKAYLKHYYVERFFSKALWRKVFTGKFNFYASLASLGSKLSKVFIGGKPGSAGDVKNSQRSLPQRMLEGLQHFNGEVLLILSGNDLTADEFRDVVQQSSQWQAALARASVEQLLLKEANHTFSSKAWRDQVSDWTYAWLKRVSKDDDVIINS